MAAWARRMHRRAATLGNVVTSCGHHTTPPYPRRLEKVKFGAPLEQVCKNDIPGPLLVLILKLNKEAPYKKDIFRAPGHQANMKKLIHFLQNGRLVNIDNFSVYTIASVLKKFLRKLPGGIFGPEREERLFQLIDSDNQGEQWNEIHQLITTMPVFAQHLLVLLFGTFRVIATNAEHSETGMTSEALGVSVAPSFFHSCVSGGKQAKMEDVMRFKTATRIMKYLIDNFGVTNLYGRENYKYYAKITGRMLKVDDEWIFAFRYPPETTASREEILEAQQRWIQREADRWGLSFKGISQEESHSTPALIHIPESLAKIGEPSTSGLGATAIPESSLRESHTRSSVSLVESELFKGTSSSSSSSSTSSSSSSSSRSHRITLEELKAINRYAESTKSLSYLPQVHERQTARMRTRSEWFLSAPAPTRIYVVPIEFEEQPGRGLRTEGNGNNNNNNNHHHHHYHQQQRLPPQHPQLHQHHPAARDCGNGSCTGSDHSRQPVRRTSSKEKRLLRRSSSKSKKDKENGSKSVSVEALHHEKSGSPRRGSAPGSVLVLQAASSPSRTQSSKSVPETDCPESESLSQTVPVTLSYKPRI